jgi:hypothetical protein
VTYPQCPVSPTIAYPPCIAETEQTYVLEADVTYTVEMPLVITDGVNTYKFTRWSDGVTNNLRSILLSDNTLLSVEYTIVPTVSVSGTVTNVKDGSLIPNASVVFSNAISYSPVYTDENGEYSIDIIEGAYVVTVSAPNFVSSSVPLNITGPTTYNASLTPTPHPSPWIVAVPIIGAIIYFLWKR